MRGRRGGEGRSCAAWHGVGAAAPQALQRSAFSGMLIVRHAHRQVHTHHVERRGAGQHGPATSHGDGASAARAAAAGSDDGGPGQAPRAFLGQNLRTGSHERTGERVRRAWGVRLQHGGSWVARQRSGGAATLRGCNRLLTPWAACGRLAKGVRGQASGNARAGPGRREEGCRAWVTCLMDGLKQGQPNCGDERRQGTICSRDGVCQRCAPRATWRVLSSTMTAQFLPAPPAPIGQPADSPAIL